MKYRFALVLALATLVAPAWSADAPPSDASIHELLDVTQARQLVDGISGQFNGMLKKAIAQTQGDTPLDAGSQQIVDRAVDRMAEMFKQNMSWTQLEPQMVEIYRTSFSQQEINDLLVFYRSPSGQAVVRKMPLVLQQSVAVSQTRVQAMMPQIQKITAEMVQELKAYRESHPAVAKG